MTGTDGIRALIRSSWSVVVRIDRRTTLLHAEGIADRDTAFSIAGTLLDIHREMGSPARIGVSDGRSTQFLDEEPA